MSALSHEDAARISSGGKPGDFAVNQDKITKPISEVQAEHRQRLTADALKLPALREIEKKRSQIAEAKAALESVEAGVLDAVREWDNLCEQRSALLMEISNADIKNESIKSGLEAAKESLSGMWAGWHHRPGANTPLGVTEGYGVIIAHERAIAEFPQWREAWTAKLEQVNSELVRFAKAHKITDKLPKELQ